MKQQYKKVRNVTNNSWFGESFHYWPKGALPLARAMALVVFVSAYGIFGTKSVQVYFGVMNISRQ